MNFKYTFSVFVSFLMVVSASYSIADDSEDEDRRLAQVYEKMKQNSGNVAINLDSTFGGGRCNCVCKDNN